MNNIALYGRSGSGKSTVARYLVEAGYQHVKTGRACRELCKELFQDESKTMLNSVTDALRALEPTVWLRAALRETIATPEKLVVFDSMRFEQDYVYLREHDYLLVRVVCDQSTRIKRLAGRGQMYEPMKDDLHAAEVSLSNFDFDATLVNNGDLHVLREQVARLTK